MTMGNGPSQFCCLPNALPAFVDLILLLAELLGGTGELLSDGSGGSGACCRCCGIFTSKIDLVSVAIVSSPLWYWVALRVL